MAQKKQSKTPAKAEPAKKLPQENNDAKMPLSMKNYRLMLIGAAIIVVGFILMTGGASSGPDDFNYSMFSFRRITLAPILVLGGFAFVAYGIMKKDKDSKKSGK